jgi:ribonuclease HII
MLNRYFLKIISIVAYVLLTLNELNAFDDSKKGWDANRQALNNKLIKQNKVNKYSMTIIKTDEAKTCYKN